MKLRFATVLGSSCLLFLAFSTISLAGPPPKGLVAKKASILAKMHSKASKALVNAAQDKGFADYFHAGDDASRSKAKQRVDKVSLHTQKKFHVEEMCLIDAKGPEIARIVGNKIASDLSADESGADFFKPAFATDNKKVFTSKVYVSPDVNKWVIAYVTPVLVDGHKKAVLHFEHGLNVFQDALNKGISGSNTFILAVNKEGFIVSDSRSGIALDKQGEHEDPDHYFKKFQFGGQDAASAAKTLNSGSSLSESGTSYSGAAKEVGNWTLIVLQKK